MCPSNLIMSELYVVKVQSRIESILQLKVWIVHSDVDEIPETKSFAMNLILDCWHTQKEHPILFDDLSTSQERAAELAQETPFLADLNLLWALYNGVQTSITPEEYDAIGKTWMYKGMSVQSIGRYGDDHWTEIPYDGPEYWDEKIDEYIGRVTLIDAINFPWDSKCWEDGIPHDKYMQMVPQGILEIELLQPDLVSFMVVGSSFSTASFE